MTVTWAEKATEFSLSPSHPGRAVTDSKGFNACKVIILFTEKASRENCVQNPNRFTRRNKPGVRGAGGSAFALAHPFPPSALPRPRAQPTAPRNPSFEATHVENLQSEDASPGMDSVLLKDRTLQVIKSGNVTSLLYDSEHGSMVYTAFWSRNKDRILSKPLFVNKNVYTKATILPY